MPTMNIQQILQEELNNLSNRIKNNIITTGRNASGRTISSLHVVANSASGQLFGRSPFGTLETGRKGGRVPGGFVGIIKQWIADKGLQVNPEPYSERYLKSCQARGVTPKYTPEERGLNSLAGAIAQTIKAKGTLLYRKGGASDIYSGEIPLTIDAIKQRVAEAYAWEVKADYIKLNTKQK